MRPKPPVSWLANRSYSLPRIWPLRRDLLGIDRRGYSFTPSDAEDIADEAITKFATACAKGIVEPATALAYARKITKHEVVDRIRRARQQTTQLPAEDIVDGSDDAIARLISATTGATTVEGVLKAAAARGDTTATRVLNAYLNLAESLRRDPSTREVARVALVSHRTVQLVLLRAREELSARSDDG